MKLLPVLASVAFAIAALAILLRSRVAATQAVSVADIARVLSALSAATADPAFAVFIFHTPDRPDSEGALNLQFSLEGGRPGFDWVLLGSRNVQEQQRFLEFARGRGYDPKMKEENHVKYLRVEEGDLAALCAGVITGLYRQDPTGPLRLLVHGFKWST
jgi:hypothetical protein